jgi:hypothetical protein
VNTKNKAIGVSMEWSWRRRTTGAAWLVGRSGGLLAAACALTLAACNPDNQAVSAAQPRGATVAFESVDGLPPGQFQKLVQDLNVEAQARRLAVISREQSSAYRVRGYLAVKVMKHQTTVTWVWDVFDQDEQRALRISGEETAKVRHRDAWAAADDAMLSRIARASMEQLAAFLTSPEVAPGTAPSPTEPQVAMTDSGESSPEAAGIFRISRTRADPVPVDATNAAQDDENDGPVPTPRRRPTATLSARDTLMMAASSH